MCLLLYLCVSMHVSVCECHVYIICMCVCAGDESIVGRLAHLRVYVFIPACSLSIGHLCIHFFIMYYDVPIEGAVVHVLHMFTFCYRHFHVCAYVYICMCISVYLLKYALVYMYF